MPVISLRYCESDLAPVQAFADARNTPISTAIKELAKLGLSYVEDGGTQQDQADRLQSNLQWTIEALMILRLLCAATDKTILARAQAAAVEFYKKHAERT